MPNWRRAHVPGGTFFFTVVTHSRMPFLTTPLALRILRRKFRECRRRWPFALNAIVVLPDHLHTIWSLPPGDENFSGRWSFIKREFTKEWLAQGGCEGISTAGQLNDGRKAVWQTKFWEHTIGTEQDYEAHFDYIHYKHGLVERPADWKWSSFHQYRRLGVYPNDWACCGKTVPNFEQILDRVGE